MSTKVAIVTGANKGIGLAVVKALVKEFDGTIYLTARNEDLGLKAIKECKQLGVYTKFHQLDIDNEASIVTFKEYLLGNYPDGIDILINNAGVNNANDPTGVHAEEITRINFLGTLNLSNELFPLLKVHGRVVNVSSAAGYLGHIPNAELRKKFADPQLTYKELISLVRNFVESTKEGKHRENGWPNTSYCAYQVSKVAVSAMTRIQAREFTERFPERDLVINHVHPGYVVTDMTGHTGFMTTEYGAEAITWAALLPPNVDKPRGEFIWHDKQIVDWVNGPLPNLY